MRSVPLFASIVILGPGLRCGSNKGGADAAPPAPVVSETATVPPVAFSATPAAAFADGGTAGEGSTPLEQARSFEAAGQLWHARLVLEKKALGSDGTKQEIELLARLCHDQGDEACVEQCSAKLGRKLKFDGGAPKHGVAGGEHKEPDNEVAKARDLVLKKQHKEAREILEPKVVDGKASKEEIRLLKAVCQDQGDRMCVALCDAKLK